MTNGPIRVIESIQLKYSNVQELMGAFTKMIGAARLACNGMDKGHAWGGSSTIHLQDEDGFSVTHAELVEETLSDGSKVYDVRLYFAVPDLSHPSGIMQEEKAQ